MGETGDRSSAAGAAAAQQLADDLAQLGPLSLKTMFGGHGVFIDGVMFAIVDSGGRSFLRGDPSHTDGLDEQAAERHGSMPYWEVPRSVRRDSVAMVDAVERAVTIARAARRPPSIERAGTS